MTVMSAVLISLHCSLVSSHDYSAELFIISVSRSEIFTNVVKRHLHTITEFSA